MSWQDGTTAVAIPRGELTFARPVAVTLATLSVGAGAIHLAVVGEHLREYLPFGLFFIVSGLAQVAWAALALERPSRSVYLVGLIGNVAIVALWALSRTKGLPIGPEPWMAERVELLDLLCSVYETLLAAGLAAILLVEGGRVTAPRIGRLGPKVIALGVVGVTVASVVLS